MVELGLVESSVPVQAVPKVGEFIGEALYPSFKLLGGRWISQATSRRGWRHARTIRQQMDHLNTHHGLSRVHRLWTGISWSSEDSLERAVSACVSERNAIGATINWRFTAQDARRKLHRLYPCQS